MELLKKEQAGKKQNKKIKFKATSIGVAFFLKLNKMEEQIDKLFKIIESCETSLQINNVKNFIQTATFLTSEERSHFIFYSNRISRKILAKEKEDTVS